MIPNYYVHCCIIGYHGNSLLLWFEEKICCEGLLRMGMKSFETFFYLDENAKMDGRISYTVFYMSIFPFVKYLW